MKSIIILTVSLILILSFGIWEGIYLKETSNYILGDISHVQNVLENKNKSYQERESAVNNMKETWKTIKSTWSIYINHEEIDSINQRILSYSVYVLENNKMEANNEHQNLIDNINEIVTSQKLLAQNIF